MSVLIYQGRHTGSVANVLVFQVLSLLIIRKHRSPLLMLLNGVGVAPTLGDGEIPMQY